MSIRRLLLQLLLLAVFFNTALGLPLHEAGHLQQALGGVAQAVVSDGADPAEPAETAENHGLCAWCLAFAQAADLPATGVAWSAAIAPAAQPQRPAAVAFVPGPRHWPFAARDPPQSSV
ncbi:DUF2946 family protein [Variovorax sp. HJSM1_2]|uniref:DUF2946 family protein n=1 Tax=Variovorax sp. HJSM1_2 TaxID=3366263 RepID=UPI003BE89771